MSFVILAVEALEIICDLVLKATHHDKEPEQIKKIIDDIRADVKAYHSDTVLPPPTKS